MSITRETVEHVARLAHIGLDPDEITDLAGQLSTVLDHVAKLQNVDTDGVPPTAHVVPLDNVMREDTVTSSWPPEAVLCNAPHRQGDYFQVQAIFD